MRWAIVAGIAVTELVGVSLRVVETDAYPETRDAISHDWLRFFAQYELVPLLIPNVPAGSLALLEIMQVSSLLLVGGNDVAPLDEDEGMLHIDGVSRERDITEHAMIEHAVRERLPLLGVCRGMQVINNFLNGHMIRVEGHTQPHKITFCENFHVSRDFHDKSEFYVFLQLFAPRHEKHPRILPPL